MSEGAAIFGLGNVRNQYLITDRNAERIVLLYYDSKGWRSLKAHSASHVRNVRQPVIKSPVSDHAPGATRPPASSTRPSILLARHEGRGMEDVGHAHGGDAGEAHQREE